MPEHSNGDAAEATIGVITRIEPEQVLRLQLGCDLVKHFVIELLDH
jgi:hypothetical protein